MGSDLSPPTPRYRVHAAVAGALLCAAAFWVAGEAAGHYTILYGRHGWGPWETSFLLNFVLLGVPCAALFALALAWTSLPDRVAGLLDEIEAAGPRGTGAATLAATAVVVMLVVGARYALLRNTAITDDENVYGFMARLLAQGRLYATSPPEAVRAFFDNQFVVNEGRWYGIYAPGHAAVLALGEWLGAMRWTTTAEAALTVPLAAVFTRRAFGSRAALVLLALMIVSPFFVLASATMLAHPTATLALVGMVLGATRAREEPAAVRWWLVAGAGLGWAGLTRPLTAVAFGLPWLVLLGRVAARERAARRGAMLFLATCMVAVVLLGAYHAALTGHPLRTGYHVFAETHRFTFTLGSLSGIPAPLAALYEVFYGVARVNFWLLGCPLSLLFVPWFRRTPVGWALIAGSALVIAAYAAFRIPSITVVGPVHYAEIAVPLLALSASGIVELAARARAAGWSFARRAVIAGPPALVAVAILFFWPVYGPSLRLMADIARAPYDLVEELALDRAVVFVDSLPALESSPGAWVYRQRNNSPDLTDAVLFVNDLGPENRRLMAFLPDRKPWRMRMENGRLVLRPLQ
jgi:hypothetical protein